MKISASVYSDKKRQLAATIEDLVNHRVDLLHVDCNDDLKVFEDIATIRELCTIPIDLHIITKQPGKYYDLLRQYPVEYVTFQYEDAEEPIAIPDDITGKKGLSIVTPTPVSVFEEFPGFDFILLMATVPGQSGGVFDAINFSKIRQFQKQFPDKAVHVDGGVNGEVSFILRNLGVEASVSGSFLFNAPSVGHALMDLTKRAVTSQFRISDFMIPITEAPVVLESEFEILSVLKAIENGKLGFVVVLKADGKLSGLISNADIRKALIAHSANLTKVNLAALLNTKPIVINENSTVNELLEMIRSYTFPISYLPVIDTNQKAVGIVTFVNLIKGEI